MMVHSKLSCYGHEILVQLPRLKKPIPLFVLFRALGVESDKQICSLVVLDIEKETSILDYLKASIYEGTSYNNYEDSLEYIISNVIYTPINMDKDEGHKKKTEFALDVLSNDLFPHCKTKEEKVIIGFYDKQIKSSAFVEWNNRPIETLMKINESS